MNISQGYDYYAYTERRKVLNRDLFEHCGTCEACKHYDKGLSYEGLCLEYERNLALRTFTLMEEFPDRRSELLGELEKRLELIRKYNELSVDYKRITG